MGVATSLNILSTSRTPADSCTFIHHQQVRVVSRGKDVHIEGILHGEAGLQLGGTEVDQRLDVVPVPEDEELLEPGVLGARG